ncbi:hypothetical protein HHK36_024375 [Tetracentron sinense]|uniref:Strictosidine synthase conserved region domain-containing protein n=1 Tax=Tetracentron sinense TaxID=13715 RepID=A0A834YNY7_TETSI|nr:hypothetical protein HHK36_024375 [Tetracentron sinense]
MFSAAMKLSLLPIFFLFFISLPYQPEAQPHFASRPRIHLPNGYGVGPESLAFDCNGEGPYTGVSDGRILKWLGAALGWKEFAVTSQHRNREFCDGSNDPSKENICGRPLGLKFNNATCDLYIADAYFGLLVVGRNGGVAKQLVSSAGGVPLRFTNALDIDQETGVVYFTDSSIWFQRWAYSTAILDGDRTGRLMKYDPQSKEVTVLLQGLAFANGVALSKDSTFVLVAETSAMRIIRFWLRGPRAQTSELFAHLPGSPDNINRNKKGEFWVAVNSGNEASALELDGEGKVLEVLNSNGGWPLEAISDVSEHDENLWIGSVVMPYVSSLRF